MSGFEKLARLLLSGAPLDEDVDDDGLPKLRGVMGGDELPAPARSETSGAVSDGRWFRAATPPCWPRRRRDSLAGRPAAAVAPTMGFLGVPGEASLGSDGVLPSSSMKLMSESGRVPPGWLRELRKLCKLWTL